MCSTPVVPQASARFGTIPRVTKLHEAGAHSHEKGEHENRYRWPASEGTRYLGFERFDEYFNFWKRFEYHRDVCGWHLAIILTSVLK